MSSSSYGISPGLHGKRSGELAGELHPGSAVDIPACVKEGRPRVIRVPNDLVTEAVRVDTHPAERENRAAPGRIPLVWGKSSPAGFYYHGGEPRACTE